MPAAPDPGVLDVPEAPVVPAPGVAPGVGDTVPGVEPDTPVAGGVVGAPGPAAGGHGIAVPLVPTTPEAAVPLVPGVDPDRVIAAVVPGAPGVLPVPAITDGVLAPGVALLAPGVDGVAEAVAVPVDLPVVTVGPPATPVTGTHGVVLVTELVGEPVGCVPGVRSSVPVAVPVDPDCVELPDCVAGVDVAAPPAFCAITAVPDNAAASAAPPAISANLFFTSALPFSLTTDCRAYAWPEHEDTTQGCDL